MQEIWKPIEGYKYYEVSNLGNVKTFSRWKEGRLMRLIKESNGYLRVNLVSNDGKQRKVSVHRLVAQAFLPNPYNLPEVNHKDENKENNCVDNLEWTAQQDNINYGTGIQRRADQRGSKVRCVETGITYKSQAEAARQTGIPASSISSIFQGKMKMAGGYHWEKVFDEE